jgi:hypothetical protein
LSKTAWLGILFVLAVVGMVVYSSIGSDPFRCEACMTYMGRSACRTASGRTEELARRTAIENACAQIASGVTESQQCVNTPPTSLRSLAGR